MKRSRKVFIFCFALLAGTMVLSAAWAQTDTTKKKDKMQADQPTSYTATYSSKFEIGNSAYPKIITGIWKDWDDNALDRSAKMFADTVAMYTADGTMLKGKDLNLAEAKKYRSQFTTVKSTIQAIISLKSTDRNEDWVAIWGIEESSDKDGKISQTALHEIWKFNKDGKIDVMRQYHAKIPKSL